MNILINFNKKLLCLLIVIIMILPTVICVDSSNATTTTITNLNGTFERGSSVSGTYNYRPYTVYAAFSGGYIENNSLDIYGNHFYQFYLSGVSETSDSRDLIGRTSIHINQYYSYNYPSISFLDAYCYSTPSMEPTPILWNISEDTINQALLKLASMAAPSIWGDAISLISDLKTYGGSTNISNNHASKSCTWYNFVPNTAQSIVIQPSIAPDDIAYFTTEYCVLGPDYEYLPTGKQLFCLIGPDVLPPHYVQSINIQKLIDLDVLPLELIEDLEITKENANITTLKNGGICINLRLPTIDEIANNIHDFKTLLRAIDCYIDLCNNILNNMDIWDYSENSDKQEYYQKMNNFLLNQKIRINSLENLDYLIEFNQFYKNISF